MIPVIGGFMMDRIDRLISNPTSWPVAFAALVLHRALTTLYRFLQYPLPWLILALFFYHRFKELNLIIR
jgi:hypothetical protein